MTRPNSSGTDSSLLFPAFPISNASVVSLVPAELAALRAKIKALPAEVRADLEPLADDACEQAKFRARALSLAREALEQFRVELAAAQFDLDATRREREDLRRLSNRAV